MEVIINLYLFFVSYIPGIHLGTAFVAAELNIIYSPIYFPILTRKNKQTNKQEFMKIQWFA